MLLHAPSTYRASLWVFLDNAPRPLPILCAGRRCCATSATSTFTSSTASSGTWTRVGVPVYSGAGTVYSAAACLATLFCSTRGALVPWTFEGLSAAWTPLGRCRSCLLPAGPCSTVPLWAPIPLMAPLPAPCPPPPADHDLLLSRDDLLRYGNHALTFRIVDRVFAQVGRVGAWAGGLVCG